MYLSIAYYKKSRVIEVGKKDIIKLLDSYYLGLKSKDQLDNSYNFSNKYLIALKIL